MGIYIRGMEMPKACMECPIETDYGTCGYYSLYVEAGHESDCEKRRDDCPLIEIPDKHGRLIDADAFDERVRIAGGMADEELSDDFKDGIQTTLLLLKSQRTVIEAEPPKDGE